MNIILVAGARPNFMKIAPIMRALKLRKDSDLHYKLVHTGQHYDFNMSDTFFIDLGIPKPDFFLNAGGGSHSEQTAKIMVGFEKICLDEKPDIVLVVGDVNSTLACSIVAKKLKSNVAHVEAGLRSFDLDMPEEINRMVTDSITDFFFTTEKHANINLLNEGKSEKNIHFVGHVMIDNLLYQHSKILDMDESCFEVAGLKKQLGQYMFMTLHRPSNVDDKEKLADIINAFNTISQKMNIIFPVHPRTKKMIEKYNIKMSDRITAIDPLGFKDSLYIWKDAFCVYTDSGGLQEETTALGIPCYTIRDNTERPVTVDEGSNTLIGSSGQAIIQSFNDLMIGKRKQGCVPELWDGKAAVRIVEVLLKR